MAHKKIPLSHAMEELASRDRKAEETVTTDELLAYQAGKLSAEEKENLQDRLALDPQAARAARDLARFPDIEADAPSHEFTEMDLDAGWQDLKSRLSEATYEDDAPTTPVWFNPRLTLALAAVLALLVLGLGIRVLLLETALEQLSGPQNRIVIETLIPASSVWRQSGSGEIETIELPQSARQWILILPTSSNNATDSYDLEIRGPSLSSSWQMEGMKTDLRGNIILAIPISELFPGEYEIDLQPTFEGETIHFRFHLVIVDAAGS